MPTELNRPPASGSHHQALGTASTHRRAALTLAFCALCWSTAGVITRQISHAASFELTFWRSFFCALTVTAVLLWRTRGAALAPVLRTGWPGLLSGAMWAVMFTCFMVAMTLTSVANTLLVMAVAPLFAALLAWFALGERPGAGTWFAIFLAGIGIWWMVREAIALQGGLGMLVALGVPIAAAINIVTLRRLQARVDLVPAVLIGAILSCLISLPLAWPMQAGAHDLILLALLGSVQLAIPCMLMVGTNRHLSPHEVSLIALLEVVLGPIWAWLGAGEALSQAAMQGGLLVLAALLLNEFLGSARRAPIR